MRRLGLVLYCCFLSYEANSWPVAFIGDTQSTTFLEQIIGRESNEGIPGRLFSDMAIHRPTLLFHLGDVVSCGGCSSLEWSEIDRAWEPVKNLEIPFFLIYGNHEYWGSQKRMEKNVSKYFMNPPPTRALGHAFTLLKDEIAFISIDSNKDSLRKFEWETQIDWLQRELTRLDAEKNVKAIILLTHHSPFSNSRVVGDHGPSQSAFLPLFYQSPKTVAWISGHAHGYERFLKLDKHFLVSAGGGGPRQMPKAKLKHEDFFHGPYPRPFNYILLNKMKKSVLFTIMGLDQNQNHSGPIDELEIQIR